jgi:hypothetical protein
MSAFELAARLAAWLVAAGFILLLAFVALRRLRSGRMALDGVIYILLVVFLTSLFTLLAGLAGLLRPAPLAAIAAGGLGVLLVVPGARSSLREIPGGLRSFLHGCKALWNELPRWLRLLTALGIGLGAARFAFLIWALPPFVWDSLTYHLTNVAHWIQAGRIELFDTPVDRIYSPANYELLATWFSVFLHHDAVVEAAGLPAYLIGLVSVYCIGRSLGASRSAAWIGMLAYGSTPALLIATTGTKNDPHVAGYFLATLALAIDLSSGRSSDPAQNSLGEMLSVALALLLAAGTKAYIAHILPGLALIAALYLPGWRSLKLWRGHLAASTRQWRALSLSTRAGLGVLLCAGLLLGGYWNVRNWILTGNPFYPYGVIVEGSQVIQGPESYYHLGLDRLAENLANFVLKFGDRQGPIRPDLPNTTGWGWFAYGIGLPVALWGLPRRRRARVLWFGFLVSLLTIMLSNRPSPWNMRYVVWFPALFCLVFAVLWDERPTGTRLARGALSVLYVLALSLNFATTLNYDKISAEEFRSMLRLPALRRDAAVFEDNMPAPYANALEFVPNDALLGYNVHNNGFVYPLYRSDFSQRIVYVPFSPQASCEGIAGSMGERGTRYLVVAPEHTKDENIARLRECAEVGTIIRERAQGLYVLR